LATKNPITLLMSLDINGSTSQQNVNQYVKSLKKYYDRNPLLITLGINKGNIEKDLNEISKVISKKQNELKVNIGSSNAVKDMKELESQINKVIAKLTELDRKMRSIGSSSNGSINLGNISSSSIANSIAQLQALNSNSANNLNGLQRSVNDTSRGLTSLSNNINQTSRSTNELGNAFSEAFTKFPIWLIASSSVFLPLQGIKDLTERVIELDTAMTNLKRVMDLPDYKFNEMLEKSIENTELLSGKVEDYLKLVGEFGRTGRNDKESLELANVSTILQNISELTADEAVNSLTAAMISFGIAAEDSLTIADKLNEVDNNYSITTRDLSLSMNKAASTARTFGVSLDELLGYTTAKIWHS